MKTTIKLAILLLGIIALSTPVPGQFGCSPFLGLDDGFDPGCCVTPTPLLPEFPAIVESAVYARMDGCSPTTYTATIDIDAPTFLYCDYAYALMHGSFTIPASLGPAMTIPFNGTVIMKYSRTWGETGTTVPVPHQVWRFLVQADIDIQDPSGPMQVGGTTGPFPACSFAPYNHRVHFVGHIDYACTPFGPATGGNWASAFSFTHLPECLSHAPYSQRPIPALAGSGTSFHLVGPAPFTFGPILEPQGPIVGEAVRGSYLSVSPLVYQCQGEADVQQAQGFLATQSENCLCSSPAGAPTLWKHQILQGAVCCNGPIRPFHNWVIPGFTLPTGFSAMTLGAWTGAGAFPANRALTVYVGLLDYVHPCPTGVGGFPGLESLQVVTGVATSEHPYYSVSLPNSNCAPLQVFTTNALDLQNMVTLHPALPGHLVPTLGGPFVSTLVWNLNLQ